MTAQIYVGTYAKYNAGSIKGAWLNLSDYADKEDFLAACHALHRDEADPELMFQDYEGFPRSFYGESYIDPALWDWLALDDDDRELLAVYQDNVDSDGTIETARDCFAGRYDSETAWAEEFIGETGALESMPENLRCYFDYGAYARGAGYDGMSFVRHDGETWVFSN